MTDIRELAAKIWNFCHTRNRAMIHDDVHVKALEYLLIEAMEEQHEADVREIARIWRGKYEHDLKEAIDEARKQGRQERWFLQATISNSRNEAYTRAAEVARTLMTGRGDRTKTSDREQIAAAIERLREEK